MSNLDSNLRIIPLESSKELGEKIIQEICKLRGIPKDENKIEVQANIMRFSNGEGKAKLEDSVRLKDVYIIADVGNYGISYKAHGRVCGKSPDDIFQDLKRAVAATRGNAERITVIMPLLYQSRQDKRRGRESLDCAIALQELEKLGVEEIIVFDVHNPAVCNAIPMCSFENVFPTNEIVRTLVEKENITKNNLAVVAPDKGAIGRATYYSDKFGDCFYGFFNKIRNLDELVDGKNPIIEHKYVGINCEEKIVLIVDDMIASGTSVLDVAEKMSKKNEKVFIVTTFTLFTEGSESFQQAYEKGYFTKLYTTNISYVPKEIQQMEWFEQVDCSKLIATVIDNLNRKESLSGLY